MIYPAELYLEHVAAAAGGAATRVGADKVALAMALASTAVDKSGVALDDFLALAELAEAYGCLSLYVDVYGRPVAYLIWGYCDRSTDEVAPTIWFGEPGGRADLYLIDFVVRPGNVDATIARWLDDVAGERLTVRRPGRPKPFRAYALSRLRRMRWRTSRLDGRFDAGRGVSMAEYEVKSMNEIALLHETSAALAIVAAETGCKLDITRAVPLISDLIEIDQCQIAFGTVLTVAMSDAQRWNGATAADGLARPLRDYIDGPTLIVTGLYGDPAAKERALRTFLARIGQAGERECLIPADLAALLAMTGEPSSPSPGWWAAPTAGSNLARLVA